MNDNLLLIPDPQPTRADALKNRALLLETAQRLFAAQSVDAVSMTAIAEAAGVGKGTLYRHFENKNQLCHALLDQEMRDLQERALRRLQNQGDPVTDLRWFVEQVALFVFRNIALLHAGSTGFNAVFDHPAHIWWRQTIRGLLARVNPDADLDYLTDVLYVLLDVHTLQYQHIRRGYDIPRILDGLNTVIARITT